MIVEIDNIELSFAEKRILNAVYLKAETGRVTGILGSNGCGKSSLLNIIFGRLKPKYKLVRIDKKPFLKPLYQSGAVKYLPQHNFIPNRLRILKVFKLYKVNMAEFILDFPKFKPLQKAKIKELSGGEIRILETYIVLKSPAKIVLLDEPFTHIAPLQREKIKSLIQKEQKSKAIIITDHLFRDILEISDDLYLLKSGATKKINNIKELEDSNFISSGAL